MFGLFGKKKEKQPPVILDLSVKEKPDGWDELIRLGFEPVFVNHRPRPNGISGDYVQTRWRLKANPDVTCTVYDSWEGGGGATFLDFDAPSTTAMTSIAACPCPVVPVNGCNRSPTFN